MPIMDQAVWAEVNVSVGGEPQVFTRGALLPDPVDEAERSNRLLLRLGGAIRVVEVVYTPEELADQALAQAAATAQREAALDVDSTLPVGDQVPGTGPAGAPTLHNQAGGTTVLAPPRQPPAKQPRQAGSAKRGAGGQFTKTPGGGEPDSPADGDAAGSGAEK